ncbi:hypothetical protein [Stenomitos frigidus]|uniref:Uncharacterized protein n=1 Tax=Stenomitos frigidus ULC18 TaxID=2107698 RepID=A0A2T1EMD6_9CYAN|nr:hypothetical protein [Stenomitos frigidus]PSB33910.1 hypothetical protein C7B82_03330 [Stenomitos frigidus ULC18]
MTKPKGQTPLPLETSEEEDLAGAITDLKLMNQKPKRTSPEQIVLQSYTELKTAVDLGYSFTDIATVFTKRRVKISARQLKELYDQMQATRTQEAETLPTYKTPDNPNPAVVGETKSAPVQTTTTAAASSKPMLKTDGN